MKPTAHIIAGIFLVASLAASCDSCNKKHDESPDNPTMTTTETVADTTITADGSANEPTGTATNDKSSASSRSASKTTDKAKNSTAKDKDGYSAADGTDAENHDGDQYTRNDQKPMPSGPPMK